MSMGWDYPPGLAHDPRAPWNEKNEPDDDEPEDEERDE